MRLCHANPGELGLCKGQFSLCPAVFLIASAELRCLRALPCWFAFVSRVFSFPGLLCLSECVVSLPAASGNGKLLATGPGRAWNGLCGLQRVKHPPVKSLAGYRQRGGSQAGDGGRTFGRRRLSGSAGRLRVPRYAPSSVCDRTGGLGRPCGAAPHHLSSSAQPAKAPAAGFGCCCSRSRSSDSGLGIQPNTLAPAPMLPPPLLPPLPPSPFRRPPFAASPSSPACRQPGPCRCRTQPQAAAPLGGQRDAAQPGGGACGAARGAARGAAQRHGRGDA